MVPDARCGLRREKVAAGGLEKFHRLVFKRGRIGEVDHHLRAGHGLFEALAGDGVDAAIGRGGEDLVAALASGRPPWLDDGQLAALKALVLRGPDPERDGVSTWRAKDLCRIVEQRFGVSYTENGMLRLLHDLGLSWQKARPIHPEADRKAQVRFKKNSRR
jgi:transposase